MDINKTISTNVYALLGKSSVTQKKLAYDLGIKIDTLFNYLKNRAKWDTNVVNSIAKYFNVPLDYLYGNPVGISNEVEGDSKARRVAVLGKVECGIPITAQINNNALDLEHILIDNVARYKNPFVLIAEGESMSPFINPKDYILCIDDETKIKNKATVVVSFKTEPDNYEANAKLYYELDDSHIMLYSINTKFPPTVHKKRDVAHVYKVIKIIREVK
ncbi:MAG: LexA family transcriptional regulator [Ignavibacteriae bacterium]|nr:LexA family transcriptional regulator [Ignavibacteriota bacterium]